MRRINSCITQLKAQRHSRTCNESTEEEGETSKFITAQEVVRSSYFIRACSQDPHGGLQGFVLIILEGNVTKFAPRNVLKLMACDTLTFDERAVDHRVVIKEVAEEARKEGRECSECRF